MDASTSKDIVYITGIKKSVPFLKVFARKRQSRFSVFLEERLVKLFDKTEYSVLKTEDKCIAKLAKNKYERCRITSINSDSYNASVHCYDTGLTVDLTLDRLRVLKDEEVLNIKSLYREFIIAGLKFKDSLKSNQKTNEKLLEVRDFLLSHNFKMASQKVDDYNTFISLESIEYGKDFVKDKILKGGYDDVFESVSLKAQYAMLEQLKEYKKVVDTPYIHTGLNVSLAGDKGDQREVCIVNFDQGITSFYIRYFEDEYHELQSIINGVDANYERLRFYPLPQANTRCIVRHDKFFYRASIEYVDLSHDKIQVLCIDNGKKCKVNKNEVYVMPHNIASFPAMAKRFQLADFNDCLDESTWDFDNKIDLYNYLFSIMVKDKRLTLKYKHSQLANIPRIPSCYLYANYVEINSKIRNYNPHEITVPTQDPLENAKIYDVEVVHTFSLAIFHVHLKSYSEMLEEMESKIRFGTPPKIQDPKIGDYVIATLYQKEMRCRIEKMIGSRIYSVYAIDYGCKEDVHAGNMKIMSREIANYPPFAYSCFLRNYEETFDEGYISCVTDEFTTICEKVKMFKMISYKTYQSNYFEVDLTSERMESMIKYLIDFEKLQIANHRRLSLGSNFSNATSIETHFKKAKDENESDDVFIRTLCESPDKSIYERTIIDQVHNSTEKSDGKLARRDLSNWNSSGSLHNSADNVEHSTSGRGSMSDSVGDFKDLLEQVRISELTSAMSFTIQKYSDQSQSESVFQEIQNEAKNSEIFGELFIGNHCLAFSEMTEIWHRARIIDVDVQSLNSFFVVVTSLDDGTKFIVTSRNLIRCMSLRLWKSPQLSLNCSLPINYSAKFEASVTAILQKYHMVKGLHYQPIVTFNNAEYIELFDNHGKNVVDLLVETKFCKRTFVVPSGKSKIIHYQDFKCFVVISESSKDIFNQIRIASESKVDLNHQTEHKIGKLVWANLDNGWSRARINRIGEKGEFNVYLIDDGIDKVVSKVRDIKDQNIIKIPPLAYKCSLLTPEKFDEDFDKIDEKVHKVLKDANYRVSIEMKEPGVESAKVDFTIGKKEKSICEELFGTTENVKKHNSNSNFEIHDDEDWHGY